MSKPNTTWFVGLDVHTKSIVICVLDATGKVVRRDTIKSRRTAWTIWLGTCIPPGVTAKFALEALAPSRWVLLELLDRELEATLVHPYGVKLIVQSRKKSDRVDAFQLADLLRLGRLPAAYVATPEERELRELVRHRADLQAQVVRAKNRIHSMLQERDEHFEGSDLFGKKGRVWLGRRDFRGAAKLRVEQLLASIDLHSAQLAAVEGAIDKFVLHDPFVELLRTIPGVGNILSATIRAEAGDIRRFDRPEQFAAYVGLVPATWESGDSRTSGGITKQGNRLLRYAFVLAVLHTCRWSAEWKSRYVKLRRRIKKHKARVAMARRLAVAVWYMARTGEVFRYRERPAKEPAQVTAA